MDRDGDDNDKKVKIREERWERREEESDVAFVVVWRVESSKRERRQGKRLLKETRAEEGGNLGICGYRCV